MRLPPAGLLALTCLATALVGLLSSPVLRSIGTLGVLGWLTASAASSGTIARNPIRPDLPPPSARAPADAPPNLVLIVLDTVRADFLAPYGHPRATTPRLDAFVDEHCVRYDQSRAAGTYTLPAHASLFTGLYPAEHGVDHPRSEVQADQAVRRNQMRPSMPLGDDMPTLASELRGRGFRTAGVVANAAYLHPIFGLDNGFEHWDARKSTYFSRYYAFVQHFGFALRVGHVPYRDGDAITRIGLAWIDALEPSEPFFLFLNYMDAHDPYLPTRANRDAFGDEQPSDPLDPPEELFPLLYERCLLDLDRHVGDLLDGLVARELLDETVLVITSDHGEGFHEHGITNHGLTVYDEVARVPLYVKPLGPRPRAVEPRPISGVEVPRVAFELLGLGDFPAAPSPLQDVPWRDELASEWFPGEIKPVVRDWAEARGRDPAAWLLSWTADGRKWIVGSDEVVEAFDLLDDPLDLVPLELTAAERAEALERARTWWEANPPRVDEGPPIELDDDHLERMRALGYVDGE